jgi:hypothetical protein
VDGWLAPLKKIIVSLYNPKRLGYCLRQMNTKQTTEGGTMKGAVNSGTGMTEGEWAEHLYEARKGPIMGTCKKCGRITEVILGKIKRHKPNGVLCGRGGAFCDGTLLA